MMNQLWVALANASVDSMVMVANFPSTQQTVYAASFPSPKEDFNHVTLEKLRKASEHDPAAAQSGRTKAHYICDIF